MASSLTPLLLLVVCSLTMAEAKLRVFDLRATGLPADLFGISDGYVKVYFNSDFLGETAVRHDAINPWWDEEFFHYSAREHDTLRLEVHDSDLFNDDLLGVCTCQIRLGTYEHDCKLQKGGTLHYTYTLS